MQSKAAAVAKFIPDATDESKNDTAPSAHLGKLQAQLRARDEAEVDLARKTGDFALYGYYLRFIGVTNLLLVVGGTATYSFFITVPQLWLKSWIESGVGSTLFYTCGYMLLSFISWSSTSATLWSVARVD